MWENYYDQDGSDEGIFGQRFDDSNSKVGNEFQANTYTPSHQRRPDVAAGNGAFVVVWMDTGYRDNAFAQLYDNDGVRVGSEFKVASFDPGMAYYPKVAMHPDGHFVVVWASLTQDGSDDGVFARRFSVQGEANAPEFQVNTYTLANQQHADVACHEDGTFFVVWESFGQDGSDDGIFGQYFSAVGGPVGPEFQINAYTPHNQFRPHVTWLDSDRYLVVWSSDGQDGDDVGVYGRLVASSSGPVGEEFQVNTYTTGPQGTNGTTAVARTERGRVVVVWESGAGFEIGQDGNGPGVFAKKYCVENVAATCGDATCRNSIDPDPAGPDAVTATDALLALDGAVALDDCALCRCDVNDSNDVTATDALLMLHKSVGQPVSLVCPPCSATTAAFR